MSDETEIEVGVLAPVEDPTKCSVTQESEEDLVSIDKQRSSIVEKSSSKDDRTVDQIGTREEPNILQKPPSIEKPESLDLADEDRSEEESIDSEEEEKNEDSDSNDVQQSANTQKSSSEIAEKVMKVEGRLDTKEQSKAGRNLRETVITEKPKLWRRVNENLTEDKAASNENNERENDKLKEISGASEQSPVIHKFPVIQKFTIGQKSSITKKSLPRRVTHFKDPVKITTLKKTVERLDTKKNPVAAVALQKPDLEKSTSDQVEEFDTDEEDVDDEDQSREKKTETGDYSKHLSYEGDSCIYTEPETGRRLIWNAEQNAWVAGTDVPKVPKGSEEQNDYRFDGDSYLFTDKNTGVTYKFDQAKNEWTAKSDEDHGPAGTEPPVAVATGAIYGFENDTHTYTDPSDGSTYMWDREKNAWFPKVDDEFLARYQLSYGFVDSSTKETKPEQDEEPVKPEQVMDKEQLKAEAKRKAQEPATWFEIDEAHNTAVYISGLPLDITMEELTELLTKCGLIARDDKGKDKIKLYKDSDGEPKGDALCTYIKVESVELALKLLDGWQIRGKTLAVQRAKFQLKGAYDPALKPKKRKKDKERLKKNQDKLFDWRPERMRGEPQKCERIVIIKNLFSPEDFDKEVALLLEYQQDIRSECLKCGDVKKVTIYDRHPEGVAQVTFREPSEAQACIRLLNGRWFGQRKISAEIWDGKTKYKIAETDAEIEARLAKWDKFLDDEDEKKEAAARSKAAESNQSK